MAIPVCLKVRDEKPNKMKENLSSVVLEGSGKERLSEVEPRYPEIGRSSFNDPFLHEDKSVDQIVDP